MRSIVARYRFLPFTFAFVVLAASGCNVFDEGLLDEQEGEPPPGMEPPPMNAELAVSDQLVCDAPIDESLNDYRHLDTSLLENNQATLPNCLGEIAAPGNDAFFSVDMLAGQRWHFHVKVSSPTIDPALYVLDSCSDSRSCQDTYFGINACAEGESEHFSFIAPTSGRYFVGVDSLLPGGEPIDVWAVHAECGNGSKEHSEYCDDGNDDPSDGCHRCRPILDRGEIEPNDGPLDPDLILLPDGFGSRKITGTLGGRCDFDFFQIEIPSSAVTHIALTDDVDCGRTDLELRPIGEPNPFTIVDAAPGAACEPIEANDLAPGTYLVRVASRRGPSNDGSAVDYGLEIDVRPVVESED